MRTPGAVWRTGRPGAPRAASAQRARPPEATWPVRRPRPRAPPAPAAAAPRPAAPAAPPRWMLHTRFQAQHAPAETAEQAILQRARTCGQQVLQRAHGVRLRGPPLHRSGAEQPVHEAAAAGDHHQLPACWVLGENGRLLGRGQRQPACALARERQRLLQCLAGTSLASAPSETGRPESESRSARSRASMAWPACSARSAVLPTAACTAAGTLQRRHLPLSLSCSGVPPNSNSC